MEAEELAIFELAFHLKCSAYDIKYGMTYEEFTKWQVYLDLRPIGWRDDTRFLKIMQCLGVKDSGEKIFESLARLKKGEDERAVRNEMVASLRNSVMFTHLLGAVGGDKLELLERL